MNPQRQRAMTRTRGGRLKADKIKYRRPVTAVVITKVRMADRAKTLRAAGGSSLASEIFKKRLLSS